MKLIITTGTLRGVPCARAQAILPKSKKLGVLKKRQKTWSFQTVAPEFTSAEIRPMIEAEAKRWEAKQMANFARERELSDALRYAANEVAKLAAHLVGNTKTDGTRDPIVYEQGIGCELASKMLLEQALIIERVTAQHNLL